MAQYNIPEPPNTSDPKRISAYLSSLCGEYLPHILRNIDEDNLSEDIVALIKGFDQRLQRIEKELGITGQE